MTSTRGKVARGKPAYDDATEIYGRSAHPSGLRPEDRANSSRPHSRRAADIYLRVQWSEESGVSRGRRASYALNESATAGSRTRVPSLEGLDDNRYTTVAHRMRSP